MALFSASLAVLFFFSGAAALVYQVLWLRLMGLVFGVTVHAATTVLASFMSGLAIGSIAAGRLAPRFRRPLLWFAVAELLIGVAALATQPGLRQISDLYVGLYPWLASTPGALTAARFLAAWVVLLVPTALMGASLPLVLKSSLARDEAVGPRFALLYASNTAGAIAGTLFVGFVLIERVGIAASFQIAATTNAFVAIGAVALDRFLPRMARAEERVPATAPELVPLQAEERPILVVFAISGFAALALEIVWFRLLVLFVPATTYAFSTMLAAVLFGIAVGSGIAAPLLRGVGDARRTLGHIELAVAFAAMLSMAALAVTYRAGWRTSGAIQVSLLTIAPACVLMGLAFPVGVTLMTRSAATASAAASRVAILYAVNVGGAIAGGVVAGFFLVPALGIARSLVVISACHLAAGVFLLIGRSMPRRLYAAAAVAAFVAIAVALPDPVTAVIRRRYGAAERIWWREEGAQSTVNVHVRPGSGRQILYLDGLHQANDSPEMVRVHRQIGHLPMAVHPDPREALVIGLGAGATAGAVSRHGAAVTIVELSPSVVRAARLFGPINEDVVDASNVQVTVDDARNHLLMSGPRYDVITADIIQPIHAGAGNLYSREYFTLVRNALKPGGIALQWIGNREVTPYRLIMQTFLSVFPNATLWVDGTLMVGSVEPLVLSRASFERKLADPRLREALSDVGLGSWDALLAAYTGGPHEMRRFVGDTPALSDDRPRIEYFGSLPENERGVNPKALRGDVRRHLAP